MQDKNNSLISGNLSLDLVNTELVRRGQRYDLLITNEDVLEWLHVIKVNLPFGMKNIYKDSRAHESSYI